MRSEWRDVAEEPPRGGPVEYPRREDDGWDAPVASHVQESPERTRRTELSGRKSDWNEALQQPLPDSEYLVDGKFTYITDSQGRVRYAEMNLTEVVRNDRNRYRQKHAGGADRLVGDEGGHIFATAAGGPGEGINVTAMDAAINQSVYKETEKLWLDAAALGKQVTVGVTPQWDTASGRPEGYWLTYTIDGEAGELMLDNRSYLVDRD